MITIYYTQDVPKEHALKIFATIPELKGRHHFDGVYQYYAEDRCFYIRDDIVRPESIKDITTLKARWGYDTTFIDVSNPAVKLLIGSLI